MSSILHICDDMRSLLMPDFGIGQCLPGFLSCEGERWNEVSSLHSPNVLRRYLQLQVERSCGGLIDFHLYVAILCLGGFAWPRCDSPTLVNDKLGTGSGFSSLLCSFHKDAYILQVHSPMVKLTVTLLEEVVAGILSQAPIVRWRAGFIESKTKSNTSPSSWIKFQ